MSETCKACGSELFAAQRFCRACGAPTETLSPEEAPTRMMPPQPGWSQSSAANTAPTGRPETSPVYAPPGDYRPSVPPVYPQVVPPYVPPRSKSPIGWILAIVGMALFAVIVVAVMFAARFGRGAVNGGDSAAERTVVLEAGEKSLDHDADEVTTVGSDTTQVKTFPLSEKARFSVKSISGNITVGTWDQPRAEVKVFKRASDPGTQVIFKDTDGNLSLRTVQSRGNRDVRYEIRLPRKLGRVELESVNGAIKISGVEGVIVLSSVNGSIDVSEVVGVSKVQTQNGRITGVLAKAADDSMELKTMNGRIELTLKSGFEADLEVSSARGGVDIDDQFGIPVEKEMLGRRAEGKIGDGGPRLKISTINGSIKLIRE